MKNLLVSQASNLLKVCMAGSFLIGYTACQKADPSPMGATSIVQPGSSSSGSGTTFMASVNSSSTMNFTPSKNTVSGNTTLTGTNTYYTITITFPSTTGPGHYTLGFTSSFTATVYDGSNTYYVNPSYGSGSLYINSISGGAYTGTFNFTGEDAALNFETVSNGSFTNL